MTERMDKEELAQFADDIMEAFEGVWTDQAMVILGLCMSNIMQEHGEECKEGECGFFDGSIELLNGLTTEALGFIPKRNMQ